LLTVCLQFRKYQLPQHGGHPDHEQKSTADDTETHCQSQGGQ